MSGEQSLRDRFTNWLANPNVMYVLLILGIGGLLVEFNHPGLFVPGIVGLICLILFAFSSAILPVSAIGILLIAGAIVLFVLEVKVTSYGLLTVGGLACLIAGSLMLFQGPIPEMRLTLGAVLPGSLVLAGTSVLVVRLAVQAHRAKVVTGVEGIAGEVGEVTQDLVPEGKVFVHGEIWSAVAAAGSIPRGARVRVVRVEGFRLVVEPEGPNR